MPTKSSQRPEASVSNRAALRASKNGAKTFRNNVGSAFAGRKVREFKENGKRYIVLENPRRIDFGLMKGSGDRIGWLPVRITAEMVGSLFARFVSLEMKTTTGKIGPDQIKWDAAVTRDGGLSGIVRSDDDVDRILNRLV